MATLAQNFIPVYSTMADKYEVTIGIPVYNVDKYIKKSILSALDQTFEGSIEILVLNDCATDKSIDIVEGFKKTHPKGRNIHIINHTTNLGVGIARNSIIKNAQGKYLFFLDSDDYITNDCIQKLYTQAETHHAEVVYGSVATVNTNGVKVDIGCNYLSQPYKLLERKDSLASYAFQNLHENLRNYVWNTLFRYDFLIKHNLKFPEIRFHEDVIFSTDMVPLVEKCVLLPDITYYYVIRNHSLSNLQGRTKIDLDEILEFINIYTYVKNKNKTLKNKPYYEARCARSMTQMLYIVSGVIKNRKIVSPPLKNNILKKAMIHPATLSEIMNFRRFKLANLAFYSLGVLPSWLTVTIITIVAKYKHLL